MNLLITGVWAEAEKYIPEIEAKGHQVLFLQQEKDELPCRPDWVEGVICGGLFLFHPIEAFVNLKYIQLTSAGYDHMPMEYVKAHPIEFHNAHGVYSVPMAEFAIAGVLSVFKKLNVFYEQQKKHEWKKDRNLRELAGKTVVIVGCGEVGAECAKRFKAFDTTVIGVNRTMKDQPFFDQMVDLDKIDRILETADVVVIAIALSEETRGLVKARQLKKGALLVNVSRGAVVDLDGVQNAFLDVFENEPLEENDPLWDTDNILITPHNSFAGDRNDNRLSRLILSNLKV